MKDWVLITVTLLAATAAVAFTVSVCTKILCWTIEVVVGIAMAVM